MDFLTPAHLHASTFHINRKKGYARTALTLLLTFSIYPSSSKNLLGYDSVQHFWVSSKIGSLPITSSKEFILNKLF